MDGIQAWSNTELEPLSIDTIRACIDKFKALAKKPLTIRNPVMMVSRGRFEAMVKLGIIDENGNVII